jgi:transcriptional regulator with XRE-family HTH domain
LKNQIHTAWTSTNCYIFEEKGKDMHRTSSHASRLAARNREIGSILSQARKKEGKSITECAQFLCASRRRYRDMEQGEIVIGVAELEMLMNYLNISPLVIWPTISRLSATQSLMLKTPAGESVRVTIEVASAMDETTEIRE